MANTYDKELRQQFFKPEHFVTETDNTLLADIQKIESDIKRLKRERYTPQEVNEYAEEALFQAQSKHWKANEAKRKTYEAELEKLGAKWKRENDGDPTRALLERQRSAAQYSLMTDDDLLVEANSYIEAQGEDLVQSPDRLEVLAKELKSREDTREMGTVL